MGVLRPDTGTSILQRGARIGYLSQDPDFDPEETLLRINAYVRPKLVADTAIAEVMVRKVSTVSPQADASLLPRMFERGEVALVVDDERKVLGILTKLDLIEFLTRRPALE